MKTLVLCKKQENKPIHLLKKGFTKIELENLKVIQNYLKPKDLKMALLLIKDN